eukprot:467091_1
MAQFIMNGGVMKNPYKPGKYMVKGIGGGYTDLNAPKAQDLKYITIKLVELVLDQMTSGGYSLTKAGLKAVNAAINKKDPQAAAKILLNAGVTHEFFHACEKRLNI